MTPSINLPRFRVLQIRDHADPAHNGAFMIVETAESWGVLGHVHGFGLMRLAWSHVEDTGGSAPLNERGLQRSDVPLNPAKHHP